MKRLNELMPRAVAALALGAIISLAVGNQAMANDVKFDPYASTSKFTRILQTQHQVRDVDTLSNAEAQRVNELAVQQASIWADTILEGDFEAAGDTRVDRVQGVFAGDKLVAYHVTFSETAWSTANCQYNPQDKSTLAACAPGRIVEAMFVTPDLRNFERDERLIAHFVN